MLKLSNLLLTGALASFINEKSEPKTLVLLDDWSTISTHETFFDHISETLNHEVRFSLIDTKWLEYKQNDIWAFENVIIIAPSVKGKQN
jgi:hypothetical protein